MRRIESFVCIALLLLAAWFSIQSLSQGTGPQAHAVIAKSNAAHGAPRIAFDSAPLVSTSLTSSNNPISAEEHQTLSATVEGGTPPYTYNFLVYDPSGNLVANNLTVESNTFTFQQQDWGTGTFTADLIVNDSANPIATVTNTLTYVVQSVSTTSTSTSTSTTTIPTFNTTFSELGLPLSNERWYATLNGDTENATVPNAITFNTTAGNYLFTIPNITVLSTTTYSPNPQGGNVMAGNNTMIEFNSTTASSTSTSSTTSTSTTATSMSSTVSTSTTSSTSSITSSTSSSTSTSTSTSTTTISIFSVTFSELGLPNSGEIWSVTFNGNSSSAIVPNAISFGAVPDTTYPYITHNVTASDIVYTPNPIPDTTWETDSNSVPVVYSSPASNSTTSTSTTTSTSISTSTTSASTTTTSSTSTSTSIAPAAVQTAMAQSSSKDGNGGANATSGGGSGKPISVFSYSDPALNLSCSEIVNFSERDSVNISVRGQAFAVVDNFITPNSTGVTINGQSITLVNGTAGSLSGAYSAELVNVSYAPILHTTKIVICGQSQTGSPLASPIELPDPATLTTIDTIMPATASESTSVTTIASGVAVSGIAINMQAIAATGIALAIGISVGIASNMLGRAKRGQGGY